MRTHLEYINMVDHKTDTLSLGGGGGSKGRKDRRDRRPSKNTPAPSNSGGGNRVDLTEVQQCAGWAATGGAWHRCGSSFGRGSCRNNICWLLVY